MSNERARFLQAVAAYVAKDPEAAPLVVQAASAGVSEALREALARAADMETALAVALAKRYKGADALIYEKLKEWEGRTALNWSALHQHSPVPQETQASPQQRGHQVTKSELERAYLRGVSAKQAGKPRENNPFMFHPGRDGELLRDRYNDGWDDQCAFQQGREAHGMD